MSLLALRSSLSSPFLSNHFKKFSFNSSLLHRPIHRTTIAGACSAKMSTESSSNSQLTHTINLPRQQGQPVQVIAGPGVSEIDFRCLFLHFMLALFVQSMRNCTGFKFDGFQENFEMGSCMGDLNYLGAR